MNAPNHPRSAAQSPRTHAASPAEGRVPLEELASRFSHPYAQQIEQILLQELADGGTVRSLGVLYGLLMGLMREDDADAPFQPINRAIIDATDGNPAGRLDRVKRVGHKVLDRAFAARAAS